MNLIDNEYNRHDSRFLKVHKDSEYKSTSDRTESNTGGGSSLHILKEDKQQISNVIQYEHEIEKADKFQKLEEIDHDNSESNSVFIQAKFVLINPALLEKLQNEFKFENQLNSCYSIIINEENDESESSSTFGYTEPDANVSHIDIEERQLVETNHQTCMFCKQIIISTNKLGAHPIRFQIQKNCHICSKICFPCLDNSNNLGKHSTSPEILEHILWHMNVRHYKCEFCPQKFATKDELWKHVARHVVIKPYFCNLCESKFRSNTKLQAHNRLVHLKIRPFKCNSCPKEFSRRRDLQQHAVAHNSARPHVCTLCGSDFKLKCNLQRHFVASHLATAHLTIDTHRCDACSLSFRNPLGLLQHSCPAASHAPAQAADTRL